jgi:sugar lactone lactonase YvrE
MRTLTLCVALCIGVGLLPAQRGDSAAVARAHFRDAGRALREGDSTQAVASAVAATEAWPRQGAYLLATARLAARIGRAGEAVRLLDLATQMGFGIDPAGEAFGLLGGVEGFAAVAWRGSANAAPLARSSVFRRLADSTLHPEGVAFDPRTGRVFVSSIRQRKVVVVEPDGRVRDFVAPDPTRIDAVFGLAVDTARGRLWLATSAVPEQVGPPTETPGGAAVVGVDIASGAILERWLVGDTVAHVLGDVAVAPDGSVWSTDSRTPAVYRLVPGTEAGTGGTMVLAATSPEWGSPQGLAFSSDGRVAWLADWTTGLYRIEVATGEVTPVAADPGLFTLGIDGLYRVGPSRLIAIQNGIAPARVVAIDLAPDGRSVVGLSVLDRHLPLAEEPTLGTLVPGGLLYVANSPWGYYLADGVPDPGRPFPRPALLRLPLEP